jgi:hypothetical protein
MRAEVERQLEVVDRAVVERAEIEHVDKATPPLLFTAASSFPVRVRFRQQSEGSVAQ